MVRGRAKLFGLSVRLPVLLGPTRYGSSMAIKTPSRNYGHLFLGFQAQPAVMRPCRVCAARGGELASCVYRGRAAPEPKDARARFGLESQF